MSHVHVLSADSRFDSRSRLCDPETVLCSRLRWTRAISAFIMAAGIVLVLVGVAQRLGLV